MSAPSLLRDQSYLSGLRLNNVIDDIQSDIRDVDEDITDMKTDLENMKKYINKIDIQISDMLSNQRFLIKHINDSEASALGGRKVKASEEYKNTIGQVFYVDGPQMYLASGSNLKVLDLENIYFDVADNSFKINKLPDANPVSSPNTSSSRQGASSNGWKFPFQIEGSGGF